MSEGKYKHLFINKSAESIKYTTKSRNFPKKSIPYVERKSHGKKIESMLDKTWKEAKAVNEKRTAISLPTKDGTYLEFESAPNIELVTRSLEGRKEGIKLLNVRTEEINEESINKATVYIPKGKESYYIKKVQEYLDNSKDTEKGNPKNEKLIASVNGVKLAVLESMWQGEKDWIPEDEPEWCEIWLSSDKDDVENKIKEIAKTLNIEIQNEVLTFPERKVLLSKVNRAALINLMESSDDIAEFRRATETALFFLDMENAEQSEWVEDLKSRLVIDGSSNVCISILDTGVNNGHVLLKPILNDEDCLSYDNSWGTNDHEGHGTQMSGLAVYGDLQTVIEDGSNVHINHLLESGKIIPPKGENPIKLYRAITEQIISDMIINNPERKRIICIAVTAPKYEMRDGSPSSWSAAIDELTSGYLDEQQKLFIVSAGNVDQVEWSGYPDSNKTMTVQNPAQSWNAVTVGAYTELGQIDKKKYSGAEALAPIGGLSPYSSTSLLWDKKWPIKPDIVFEGGNVLKDSTGCWECEELSLLTTNYKPAESQFYMTNATSAATAIASWFSSQIQVMYPEAWPETIRALLIHSAEWTSVMKEQFLDDLTKRSYKELLKICGYGVPNLDKAIWCMKNSVNLVIQTELQPFEKNSSGRVVTKDMHIHESPWPKDVLLDLGEIPVRLKITLSYFIEPSPGEVGWKDRYRYASCGLRFDINGTDTREAFLARINAASNNDDENHDSSSGKIPWLLGVNNRNLGSIHSDVWEGTAAQLAVSNYIGIYPTTGWWKERPWLNSWNKKVRYSLIVSLDTPEQSVDLYTPIYNIIQTDVKTTVEVDIK